MDSHSPWSDLCRDMLDNEIAKRLHSDIDRLCLRAVCQSWRSLLSPPCRRPPLCLPFPMGPSPVRKPKRDGSFNLVHSTVYCLVNLKKSTDTWKTAKCWLIRIKETEEPGKFRLKDPLYWSGNSKTLSPPLPTGLNLLDYRVYEITKVYNLHFKMLSFPAAKVAVCSEGPAFGVMAIHSGGRLSIWRKGDEEWAHLRSKNDPYHARCTDVVCHGGKFYALTVSGRTVSIDLSLQVALVTQPMARPGRNMRLLSYLGDLFLLHRDTDPGGFISYSHLATKFHVYKLNEDEHKWVKVKSLGNRAMFVGDDCSFCVSTEECVGCKKNCIYYIDNFFTTPGGGGAHKFVRDNALFDMEDSSAKLLSLVLNYSGLFRPPQSWFVTWRWR